MSIKQIVTHDGIFHADDVGAVAICEQLFPDAEITRTREPQYIEPAPGRIVLDVGGKFEQDFMSMVIDHHQPGALTELVRGPGRPYATLGLVWNKTPLGRMYIQRTFDALVSYRANAAAAVVLDDPATVDYVLSYVDRVLIEPLDLRDCLGGQVHQGLPICHFGERLGDFNPSPLDVMTETRPDRVISGAFSSAKTAFLTCLDNLIFRAVSDLVTGTPVDISQYSADLQNLAARLEDRALIFTAPLTNEVARRKFEEDPKLEAVIYPDAATWTGCDSARDEYKHLALTGLKWVVRARTAFDFPAPGEVSVKLEGLVFKHATGFLVVFDCLQNVLNNMPFLRLKSCAN